MIRTLNLLLLGLLLVLAGPGLTRASTPMDQAWRAGFMAAVLELGAKDAIAVQLEQGVAADQIMAALFSMPALIEPAAAVEAALRAGVPDNRVLAAAFAAPVEVINPGAVIQAALRAGLHRDAIFNAAIIAGIHRDLIVAAINADLPPGMLAYVPPPITGGPAPGPLAYTPPPPGVIAAIRFADLMETFDPPIRDDVPASPIQ